jgi:penicillin-binding protein 2
VVTRQTRLLSKQALPPVPIKPEHLEVIRNAMIGVNKEGTSAAAFAKTEYIAAGKTGTAQVVGIKQNEKYTASKVAEHLRDHALFIAFAPADNPRVAVALVVENAGFGAQSAAPIARRVFDYVLLDRYPSEEDITAVQRSEAPAPIGSSRHAADVPMMGAINEPEMPGSAVPSTSASGASSAPATVAPGSAASGAPPGVRPAASALPAGAAASSYAQAVAARHAATHASGSTPRSASSPVVVAPSGASR